jgi:hypothetical protein
MSDEKETDKWFAVKQVTAFTDEQAALYNACVLMVRREGWPCFMAIAGEGYQDMRRAKIGSEWLIRMEVHLKPNCDRARRVIVTVVDAGNEDQVWFQAEYSVQKVGEEWESRGDVLCNREGTWSAALLRRAVTQE